MKLYKAIERADRIDRPKLFPMEEQCKPRNLHQSNIKKCVGTSVFKV